MSMRDEDIKLAVNAKHKVEWWSVYFNESSLQCEKESYLLISLLKYLL